MSDFYSVTEFAEKYHKNPGNIRRMLISGTIKGEKIGKQWIIPKETVYPEDPRIKSGKYHNWRKRSIVNQKVPKLLNSLEKLGTQLFRFMVISLTRLFFMDHMPEENKHPIRT